MAKLPRGVRFDLDPIYYYYKPSENDSSGSYRQVLQDSINRAYGEYAFLKTRPQTQLDIHSQVFEECRKHDITVIFGNLGRNPFLLTYFLDFAFTSQESVGLFSEWDVDSPYQIKPPFPTLDFLFIIEPYFGYSVVKLPHVKHLVVMTSHLVLNLPSCHMTKLYLTPPHEILPCSSSSSVSFTPPVFHDGKINQIPPKMRVNVDVTDVKSAHEAYLRFLTGREMASDRLITVQMSPRNHKHICKNIEKSREKAVILGWREDWIYNQYLTYFENFPKNK
ncbi:hypothetical protein AVEN_257678-1 [Araneus ventricosus]|uniref:Uncharacterized protein n=1 Tax=Araneus ventricosus TaxID=182803 RepID=A0A4Y2LEB9_ARAVE|nr:hypothetical protein AVEN_257678-1 [Araneus ventricosus]